ncbi:MAG: hypothetical protein KBC17_02845 [Candidatus Pacebacteria bacterium]|nr:hypothetical protein [Candidatus Paceibacterota bacterium]
MVLSFIGALISFIFFIIGKLAFIWAPILIMYFAFEMWHHYVTDRFILGMKWTLFEIQIPRNVEKSPVAMELILTNAMYHASIKGVWEVWVQGAPHFWFSLEMAGIDGQVHFYIRTPSRVRNLVETQIYAQYPQAKVVEVEDYTLRVPYDAPNDDWYLWGCDFCLEHHIAFPLRTYKSYDLGDMINNLEDNEHQKNDPITPTIEFLGSLKKGQQVWVQIVIRPSKSTYHTHGKMFTHHGWVEEVEEEIARQLAPYIEFRKQEVGPNEYISTIRAPRTVDTRVEKMKEKIQKLGFDVGIRQVVLCESKYVSLEDFNNLRRDSRLMWRQFNNPDGNSLLRSNPTQYDQPFADPTGRGLWILKNRKLNWYRGRAFYNLPFWFGFKWPFPLSVFLPSHTPQIDVLNVEEIATLFHFPGQISQAPSFRRIESRVAKPPANLPM